MQAPTINSACLTFDRDGAELFEGAALEIFPLLEGAWASQAEEKAGVRLKQAGSLGPVLSVLGPIGGLAATKLGAKCRPVRAILFDKTPEMNWGLGWHQDRTIAVKERRETEGFGPWSVKDGLVHVEPPFDLIERMITVRVHLDDVPDTNAPLLVVPGSHGVGRVPTNQIADVVKRLGTAACTARAGDVWAYATPILHASKPASSAGRRRVLQVDYSAEILPGDLEWAGL